MKKNSKIKYLGVSAAALIAIAPIAAPAFTAGQAITATPKAAKAADDSTLSSLLTSSLTNNGDQADKLTSGNVTKLIAEADATSIPGNAAAKALYENGDQITEILSGVFNNSANIKDILNEGLIGKDASAQVIVSGDVKHKLTAADAANLEKIGVLEVRINVMDASNKIVATTKFTLSKTRDAESTITAYQNGVRKVKSGDVFDDNATVGNGRGGYFIPSNFDIKSGTTKLGSMTTITRTWDGPNESDQRGHTDGEPTITAGATNTPNTVGTGIDAEGDQFGVHRLMKLPEPNEGALKTEDGVTSWDEPGLYKQEVQLQLTDIGHNQLTIKNVYTADDVNGIPAATDVPDTVVPNETDKTTTSRTSKTVTIYTMVTGANGDDGGQIPVETPPSFNTKLNGSDSYFDNGTTLNLLEVPDNFNVVLHQNDINYYDASTGTIARNALDKYLIDRFRQTVKVSDNDVKQSAGAGYDYPNAASMKVDSVNIDFTKKGTYNVKFTYTDAQNEFSEITIPVQVTDADSPVFWFNQGQDVTINTGDDFNMADFKVYGNYTAMEADEGHVAGNGDDIIGGLAGVTISGSVDTNKPGTYTLTYAATNVEGKTTTLTRRITVVSTTPGDKPVTEPMEAVGYINYVPGYGTLVYSAPNGQATTQYLPHASAWKVWQKATFADGTVWYNVGTNQWVRGTYMSFAPVSNGMTPLNGVATIDYVPGYGINVWSTSDGVGFNGQRLQHGTQWQVFGEENGYYNVGYNQWISKEYVTYVDR